MDLPALFRLYTSTHSAPLARSCAIILILLVPYSASGDRLQPAWQERVRVQFVAHAHPVVPTESELRIEVEGGAFFDRAPLNQASAALWYLAASPYLLPSRFFEVGLLLRYAILATPGLRLDAGFGTAISLTGRTVSVPAIVSIDMALIRLHWFQLESDFQLLLYAGGIIGDAVFCLALRPFRAGPVIGIGVGAMAGCDWIHQTLLGSFSIEATLGLVL